MSLCQDCFSKQGSIVRHLIYKGVSTSHVQHPLDEYSFRVINLAADLKDRVCLTRMIDIVTNRPELLPSMQIPANSQ